MKKLVCILLAISLLSLFSSSVLAGNSYIITKEGWFGAWTKDYFNSMVTRMEDTEALQKMMNAGQIFIIKKGVEVYIESSTWTGALELRPKGEVFTFWTFHEAIK